MLQRVVADLYAGKGMLKVNVKDVIFMAHSSWAEVSPSVFPICFRKAGFTLNNEASEKGTVCFPLATVLKRHLEWHIFRNLQYCPMYIHFTAEDVDHF